MENSFLFNIKELEKQGVVRKIHKNLLIKQAATLHSLKSSSIIFAKKLDGHIVEKMKELKDCLLIVPIESKLDEMILQNNEVIYTKNPRLLFAKIITCIFEKEEQDRKYSEIECGTIIGEKVKLGENVKIEPFVFIDHNVQIGDNCIIKTGARIRENVVLGKCCVVGENSVIGGQGLGIEKDDVTGRNYRIPHIGGVVVGDYVEIGALTTILSGTIEPTVVENFVFIDDLNHIAHNCKIGQGTVTTGCVQLSGSAKIGKACFIAPNSTVRNSISIGDNSFIGQATSITKDVEKGAVIAGNPGEQLERLKAWRKIQNQLLDESEG